MIIHTPTPFRIDKRLGIAYNNEFKKVADDDWVALRDYDTLFLLPDTINHLYGYVERYPECDVFTCYANRNHPSLPMQILNGTISENDSIKYWTQLAEKQKEYLYQATEIKGNISGFFMLISKRLWNTVKFPEGLKCFGVDFYYSRLLRERKIKILRMDGVLIFHSYRILRGINSKSHLL